jgi:hypothetical protein
MTQMIGGSSLVSSPSPQRFVPPDFVALAKRWYPDLSKTLLSFIWQGYDLLTSELPAGLDVRDLERSITQSLEPRIRKVMSGYEPFYIQHGPYERETMQPPPAQPPQYDLAFVFRANERFMWPIEAKVLKTDSGVAQYVSDVRNQFLKCRYGPFSSEGAMLGYLLSGKVRKVFNSIAKKIPCSLFVNLNFPSRPCKLSDHRRAVPAGKQYPVDFRCHHLIFSFHSFVPVRRKSKRTKAKRKPRFARGMRSSTMHVNG